MESIDVGCGGRPHGRVNLDVKKPRWVPNNFVLASVEYLPFKNKAFSFVSCYHVLEHLENPCVAVFELIRITNFELTVAVPHGIKERIENIFIQKRKNWAKRNHKQFFTLKKLWLLFGGVAKVSYSYRFLRNANYVIKSYSLKDIFWEFFLFLPSELRAKVELG